MNLKKIVPLLARKFCLSKHNLYYTTKTHGRFHIINRNNSSKFKMQNKDNIVWIDMELTGIDIDNDKILEIACLITNKALEIISEPFHMIIHQPDDILKNMNDWCQTTHSKTGLIDNVRKSNVDIKEAESQLLNFIKPFVIEKSCPLAGNTIWMDRIFLIKYMPAVHDYLNYRIIDVSSTKELCKRWSPVIFHQAPKKRLTHRAVEDIEESIEELRYYEKHFFKLAH